MWIGSFGEVYTIKGGAVSGPWCTILAKLLYRGDAVEILLISGRDYPNTYRSFVEMFW